MMEIDSIKAISLYQNISVPDDIITDKDFFRIHSHHCIANIYYYQTVNNLKKGKIDQAENCLLNNIKYNTLAYYEFFHHNTPNSIVKLETIKKEIEQYSAYLDSLIEAKVNYSGRTDNSDVSHLYNAFIEIQPSATNYLHHSITHTENKIFHHPFYYLIILFLLSILLLFVFYQHKYETYQDELDNKKLLLSNTIKQLDQQIKHDENEKNKLKEQLCNLQTITTQNLGIGKQIYQTIMNGGNIKSISIRDEQCFIDYYAFSWPQQYANLIAPFSKLSLRHTTYLILVQLGFRDKDIQHILFIKEATIRNYRLRMNKNKTLK